MLESKVIVIKYGGSLLEDPGHRSVFLNDVVALSNLEKKVVLVHGGGKEITRALELKGLKARFVDGLRATDDATMPIVEEVLARLNQEIVKELQSLGIRAEGYSGKTEHILRGSAVPELGKAGKPEYVNIPVLGRVLAKRSVAVFYSVAEDASGGSLNINADDFALALAVACQARRLIFLTDSGALLDKSGKPIRQINFQNVDQLIQDGTITGGMIIKAKACAEAVKKGVGRVDICQSVHGLTQAQEESLRGTGFVGDMQSTIL